MITHGLSSHWAYLLLVRTPSGYLMKSYFYRVFYICWGSSVIIISFECSNYKLGNNSGSERCFWDRMKEKWQNQVPNQDRLAKSSAPATMSQLSSDL